MRLKYETKVGLPIDSSTIKNPLIFMNQPYKAKHIQEQEVDMTEMK